MNCKFMNSKKIRIVSNKDDMDILKIIKTRRSIRKYKNRSIPRRKINKIIEAGIWGPAVPSFLRNQPWRFIVISEKSLINNISEIVFKKSKKSGAGVNLLLHSAANIIGSAPLLIIVYNSGDIKKIKDRFEEIYAKFSKILVKAELSAISATIQNMILVAENLGIGSCWLDTPLFCKKEINSLFNTNDELVALLTFGYPAEKGFRSKRKQRSEAVMYIG